MAALSRLPALCKWKFSLAAVAEIRAFDLIPKWL
jgi:hypothetical protein